MMEFFRNPCSPLARCSGWTGLMFALVFVLTFGTAASADEARLLRFPDIHEDFAVFVHGGDLWRVASSGGEAHRLTSHPGLELFPKISWDGQWIAFSAEYSGSRQIYVIPAQGGEPKQLTFYTDVGEMPPRGGYDYWIVGWTPEGKILTLANRTPWGERMGRYFLVDPNGGLETPLPLPHGGSASLSADGQKLAYTPIDREFRTWKRTRGGRAQDIWIYDLENHQSERLTEDHGTDNFPMWHGDTIYFTSDREDTLNLFAYDLNSKNLRKLTDFDTWDVLWPSLGGNDIIFQNGGHLYRFDLETEEQHRIPVTINTSLPHTVPRFESVNDNIQSSDLSPSGVRAVIEARGELFTVPREHGAIRRLTYTPHRERSPVWSPDGSSIAYFSEESGEYELYLMAQDGSGEPRRLTEGLDIWNDQPLFSPDSKKIAFYDRERQIWIVNVETGQQTLVDKDPAQDPQQYSWSPDSRFLAYQKTQPSNLQGIMVYSLEEGTSISLSDGMTDDTEPVFSSDGQSLLFLSDRDFQITFSAFEFDFLYTRASRIYIATLNPAVPHPFPERSDEEKTEKEGDEKDSEGEDGNQTPEIIVEGFQGRTLALPDLPASNYLGLSVHGDSVFVARVENGPPTLVRYQISERKAEDILPGLNNYAISQDGSKVLYNAFGTLGIADVAANLSPGTGKLDLDDLRIKIDPRSEWLQMFNEGWRNGRDWFYDPNMHGYDWKALRDRYSELVEHISHREELDFIFGQMIGELEAGHTYVQSGEEPEVERIEGGMLGCEFELDASGRYRISHIFPGENWHESYRSPLTEPGVNVNEGDFLLAIDGQKLSARDNPFRLLEGKAGHPVSLLVSDRPEFEGAREVTVRATDSELNLRYLDWVMDRIELVDRLSDGRIGYIHLPDTAIAGNRMFQKLFFGQANKEGLILDDRYNGGGFIPDRLTEYFERKTRSYWARRDVDSNRTPNFAHDGPKVMLVNGYSSSGGDALPYYFRQSGLGKLVGTRTWGGLIGTSGAPQLIDGGMVILPTFRIYDSEGNWVVENEGVKPDIEVFDLPEHLREGGDPSVEKAVEVILEELNQKSFGHPQTPTPPNLAN